jgi:hypothetical protein
MRDAGLGVRVKGPTRGSAGGIDSAPLTALALICTLLDWSCAPTSGRLNVRVAAGPDIGGGRWTPAADPGEDLCVVTSAGRDLIRRIVLDYGFWDGYPDLPRENPDDDPPELVTELALLSAGEMSLEIWVQQNPNLMTLFLRQGDGLLPELGYDDDCAQFLPWTFRWAELEYIARLAALRNAQVRHPGPLLALLSRFTPLTTDEEISSARPMLAAALNLLSDGPPLSEPRFGPTLQERLAYQLDHWDWRKKDRATDGS